MRLSKSRLALVVLYSELLLAGTLFGVVQPNSVDNNSWAGEDTVVDEADVFFDDSYIHEIRLYFDDPDWYDTLYDAHDNNRTTSDPYFLSNQAVVIRIVESQDAMTAAVSTPPWEVLLRAASRIANEVKGINRVVYDLTSKPPGTIEWY